MKPIPGDPRPGDEFGPAAAAPLSSIRDSNAGLDDLRDLIELNNHLCVTTEGCYL